MATVYLAEDLKHERKVAIKVLKPELAAVLGADRFVQEIKTTAALSHPHILPLFDSGEADGQLYYVMPYIEGETLREKLDREAQLGVDEAVRITTEVADALDYAHRHGVIHRDIKPENILLHDGRPMVMDFGIALAVSAAAGGRMTETGLSLGTPHYMSPEQATADKDITARSDIYSLASVLYEMLTGEPPHMGNSAQQIIMKIVTEEAAPVTKLRKTVPANVAAALAQALEKLPADRFDSAKAFAEALTNPAFTGAAITGAVPAAARRRQWLMWAPAAVAVAAVAVAAWSLTRQPVVAAGQTLRFDLADIDGGSDLVAISPDGRTVLYTVTESGANHAYLRSLDSTDARALPYSGSATEGTFSPDGKSVAIANDRQQVVIVPLDGGRSREVVKTTEPAGMTWAPGRGLVLGMPAFSSTVWGLSLVPLAGDSIHVLTHPKPEAMHHFPQVLADGHTVLYLDIAMEHRSGGYRAQLGVGDLAANTWTNTGFGLDAIVGVSDGVLVYRDGQSLKAVRFDPKRHRPVGKPVLVPGVPASIVRALMARNGTMAMTLMSGAYRIELVDDHGVGTPLLPDTVSALTPRFSPDGTRLALSYPGSAFPVEVMDVATRTITGLRFNGSARSLAWSPDGRRVYRANLGGSVASVPADGSDGEVDYTSSIGSGNSAPIASVAASPDGKTLMLGTGYGTVGFNLMTRALHGDTTLRPFVATTANEGMPRFSLDGKWVAYGSDETGGFEVYVRPFPGPGPKLKISQDGGDQPVWASNDRLYYLSGDSVDMVRLAPGGADGVPRIVERRTVFHADFYHGSGGEGADYDVTPDGKHFVIARAIGHHTGRLVTWVNWLGPVKAKLEAEGNK